MSIQPHRVIHRIIEQVDRCDWPRLAPALSGAAVGGGQLRLYRAPVSQHYATPIHFWVHALREDLRATGHDGDLVATAAHAICRERPVGEWLDELAGVESVTGPSAVEGLGPGAGPLTDQTAQVHRMLQSSCRRSSVWASSRGFAADFWSHGPGPVWRRGVGSPL
jgi:hypothetical protein